MRGGVGEGLARSIPMKIISKPSGRPSTILTANAPFSAYWTSRQPYFFRKAPKSLLFTALSSTTRIQRFNGPMLEFSLREPVTKLPERVGRSVSFGVSVCLLSVFPISCKGMFSLLAVSDMARDACDRFLDESGVPSSTLRLLSHLLCVMY